VQQEACTVHLLILEERKLARNTRQDRFLMVYRPLPTASVRENASQWTIEPPEVLGSMKATLPLVLMLGLASASAKQPRHYQTGKLMQMSSVPCGIAEKDAKTFTGELLGTDSSHKKTEEVLCQEYVLESDTVTYRIRPKDEKHPSLLPIGQHAQFFIQKDKMVLRVEDLDDKDREYLVVSMLPREDTTATAAPPRTKLQ
jgi:hypothetical protein